MNTSFDVTRLVLRCPNRNGGSSSLPSAVTCRHTVRGTATVKMPQQLPKHIKMHRSTPSKGGAAAVMSKPAKDTSIAKLLAPSNNEGGAFTV